MKVLYKCALCGVEYGLNGFTNHIQRTHKIKYKEYYCTYVEPWFHKCKYCDAECSFTNYDGFRRTCSSLTCVHRLQQETILDKYGPHRRSADKIAVKPVIKYDYYCQLCGAGYRSKPVLNRHLLKEHSAEMSVEDYYLKYMGVEPKQCEICGKRAKWMGVCYGNVCGSPECTHVLRSKHNSMRNPEYVAKARQALIDLPAEEKQRIREKVKMTCIEKYGVDHNWKSIECREKGYATMRKKYGTAMGALTPNGKKSILEKYGVDHFSHSVEFAKRRRKKFVVDGIGFDSKDEIKFYNFANIAGLQIVPHPDTRYTYIYAGDNHIYEPDFLVNGKSYEIKGLHFFEHKDPAGKMINPYDRSMDALYEAKHQCMIKNSVRIMTNLTIYSMVSELYSVSVDEDSIVALCHSVEFPGTEKWPANHPIWESYVPGHLSPKDAWNNDTILRKAIKNMVGILDKFVTENKYTGFCARHIIALANIESNPTDLARLVLNRFTVAKLAPKVTALRSSDLLRIVESANVDLSNGVYCPMAGFGGIVTAAKNWLSSRGKEANVEAYDINPMFCSWYGWERRDVLAQVVTTDKTVIVCPPFGKQYEHWKGTPDEMSDISFEKWVDLIQQHIIAPTYVFIGPEVGAVKNSCGLFAKKIGISLHSVIKRT